jgi:hypothetical protein
MKTCQNPQCVGHGRVIYTLATRCPLCKWDLAIGSNAVKSSAPLRANQAGQSA